MLTLPFLPSRALARFALTTLSTLVGFAGVRAQDPPAPADKPPAQQEVKPLPEMDDATAKERISQFRRLYTKKAALGKRLEGVKLIAGHRNDKLADELLAVVLKDPNPIVRAEAAKALGRQDGKKGRAGIQSCLGALQGEEHQVVLLALLDSLVLGVYDPKWFDSLAKLFPEEATPAAVQQRILKLFAAGKEKRAFRLLVDNLDEPVPQNVDDPNNPPASYWEMRWKKWNVWRLDIAKALKDLTGTEFKESKYYKEWAKGEGRKLGFEY